MDNWNGGRPPSERWERWTIAAIVLMVVAVFVVGLIVGGD